MKAEDEVTVAANRDAKGRFVVGNAGGGRSKSGNVKAMLKAATPDAVRLMLDTMNDPEADIKLRIDLAKTVWERVYGKSTQGLADDVVQDIKIRLAGELDEFGK